MTLTSWGATLDALRLCVGYELVRVVFLPCVRHMTDRKIDYQERERHFAWRKLYS